MELYQLEDFIAVVEEHSFTRAAERVCRTQGAVSIAVRRLEQEVGVTLLTRGGYSHDCTLTDAGHVTLAYARRILNERRELLQCLAQFTSLATGRVRVAAHESTAQYLLPAPLAAFHAKHPNIKIVTRLCGVDDVGRLVADSEVDLGFGIRNAPLHGLTAEVIHSEPLVLVAAPGHRLERRDLVTIADLEGESFFVHRLHTQTMESILDAFAQSGTPFTVLAELWNFETVKHFVRVGNGLAIIPFSVARPDLEAERLIAVPVSDLRITRSVEAVYREEQQLLPAPAQFLNVLRSYEWQGAVLRVGSRACVTDRLRRVSTRRRDA